MGRVRRPARASSRRRRPADLGQSLIEFSIVLPLILVTLVGVVEVTTLFVHYVSVVNASRDGARIGAKGSATDAEIRSLAANDLAKLPGGITATADVTINRTPVPGDSAISVEACYDHHLLMHVALVLPETYRICSTTIMRILPTPVP